MNLAKAFQARVGTLLGRINKMVYGLSVVRRSAFTEEEVHSSYAPADRFIGNYQCANSISMTAQITLKKQ